VSSRTQPPNQRHQRRCQPVLRLLLRADDEHLVGDWTSPAARGNRARVRPGASRSPANDRVEAELCGAQRWLPLRRRTDAEHITAASAGRQREAALPPQASKFVTAVLCSSAADTCRRPSRAVRRRGRRALSPRLAMQQSAPVQPRVLSLSRSWRLRRRPRRTRIGGIAALSPRSRNFRARRPRTTPATRSSAPRLRRSVEHSDSA
jgi:hypothetical protein